MMMPNFRVLASAVCGAFALVALPVTAMAADPRHEVVFSGVFTDNNSQTGYLSYRGLLTGSFDDGVTVRVDGIASRFKYPTGSGNRTTARVAVMRAMPIGAGALEFGAGLSFGEEKNTPAAPGDFSRVGVFVSAMVDLEPAQGHKVNLLAEYDSPDKQVFVRAYYQAVLGQTAIGPTVNWVRNDGYRRVQYGLRTTHEVSQNADITLQLTTGRERVGGGASTKLSMLELGFRTRF